jgi:ribonuclease HI
LAFKNIIVFTDGACSGNPGKGGWGSIIVTPDGMVRELGDSAPNTTNNRMEMAAALFALKELSDETRTIDLYTDSTYLIRGITQWVWGWKKRGWKTAENAEVQNRDMWEALLEVISLRDKKSKINWLYSRGHAGIPGNERCDEIAVNFSQGKRNQLYSGPLLKYDIAIHDLPDDTTLPEMKPRGEKKIAHSYLSVLNGKVERHKDWPSCERRVKGKSGAKFKKAMNENDEAEILTAWGLSTTKINDSEF